jgi:glutamate-1-semialdehyde 2,1-aminomutase
MSVEASVAETAVIQQLDAVFPGGVISTFTPLTAGTALVESAHGGRISMNDGREYLDLVMGSGPMLIGHAHPAVVEALQQQATRGTQYYVASRPAIELAEKIIDSVPCAERLKFASTGAEATLHALRLARAYTSRAKIVRFRGAYHGGHDYAMLDATAGIPPAIAETVITAEFNDIAGLEEVFSTHGAEIAAVIVEPIQRNTPPAPGFLQRIVDLCRANGAISIFDEIVTGFRIAWGGAQERYNVVPDLATYGKIIGGGLPLAAVAGRSDLLDLADPHLNGQDERYVYFSGTLNGNPLAAAAGLATLEILDDPASYTALLHIGEALRTGIRELAEEQGIELIVTGEGPLVGIAFNTGEATDPDTFMKADKSKLKTLELGLLREGVFTNLSARVYLSLAHTDLDIEYALEAFRHALTDTAIS